jgi:hypothetical protein
MAETDGPESWDKIWKKLKQADWYLMKKGERIGPFMLEDLKGMAERAELNPRHDMAWKEGMEDWIPSGDVDGLFKKNVEAETVEKVKQATPTGSAFKDKEDKEEPAEEIEWPGTGRAGFIFFYGIFPFLWIGGLVLGAGFLKEMVGPGILGPILICLSLLPIVIGFVALLSRFQNLAMSRVWFLGMLVPILNIWLGYRLFACPPGYAEHKKIGGLGVVLAVIYWVPLLAMIAFGTLATIKGPEMFDKWAGQNQELIEEFNTRLEEMKAGAEEATGTEEPEPEKEKAPTIIPY